MAGVYPPLYRTGLQHSIVIRCGIQRYRSGAEHRYALSGLLNSFRMVYQRLKWVEMADLVTFHINQKGAFDSTWTMNMMDPQTKAMRMYEHLAFEDDILDFTESPQDRYATTLSISQTLGETVLPAPVTTFPVLSTGARVQIPIRAQTRFVTERNDMDYGGRYAWAVWGTPLRSWDCDFSTISDDELKTYVDYYAAQGGPLHPFTFVGPHSGTPFTNCRFGADPIVITRKIDGVNQLQFRVEQYK